MVPKLRAEESEDANDPLDHTARDPDQETARETGP